MSNLDHLTKDHGRRLDLSPFEDGKINEARLDPVLWAIAQARYERHRRKPGAKQFKVKGEGYPPAWGYYTGAHGERGLGDFMGWTPNWATDKPDPGYDFKGILRLNGKATIWRLDAKTVSAEVVYPNVLLRFDGDLKGLPKDMVYVWCEYHLKLDQAWPQGWLTGPEIDITRIAPWGQDIMVPRSRLHPMSDLARATWPAN